MPSTPISFSQNGFSVSMRVKIAQLVLSRFQPLLSNYLDLFYHFFSLFFIRGYLSWFSLSLALAFLTLVSLILSLILVSLRGSEAHNSLLFFWHQLTSICSFSLCLSLSLSPSSTFSISHFCYMLVDRPQYLTFFLMAFVSYFSIRFSNLSFSLSLFNL